MKLSAATKVHDLLNTYAFMEDFLTKLNPRYAMLKNRMARATIGRMANLRAVANIGGYECSELIQKIAAEITRQTGSQPEVEIADTEMTREERMEELKQIIQHLHDGGDPIEAQARFNSAMGDVEPCEIAAMEQELIRGGLPVSEIQRLCDVHVGAFKTALDKHEQLAMPPGHPIHTHMAENQQISKLADELGALAQKAADGQMVATDFTKAMELLDKLSGIDSHYQRKENQLFPFLEKHGISGPPQVMWGVHDEIRATLKKVHAAAGELDATAFAATAPTLARDIIEMIYKEEKILFPLLLETLDSTEWFEVRRGEDILGYAFTQPAAPWSGEPNQSTAPTTATDGLLEVMTGQLTLEQINLILTHLPVDLSFVDESDTVRFYSEGPERIFPRSPAVIGRKVQNCHPPKSMHTVQTILDDFRANSRSVAEFWIQMHGKFIHIRYFALRDQTGAYRGCLEVSQDVTHIRRLTGEQRLSI